MGFGLNSSSLLNSTQLGSIVSNTSGLAESSANINFYIFGGIFVFISMWVFVVILYYAAQSIRDQPLANMLVATGLVTLLALFLRVIEYTTEIKMLNDYQTWVFLIITGLLAGINWMIKDT